MSEGRALQFKNATVSLLLLTPILVLLLGLIASIVPKAGNATDDEREQPPIVILSEAEGFSFSSGSAMPSDELLAALEDSIPKRLAALIAEYRCDLVEVVGHTDGQRMSQVSTLDYDLPGFVAGTSEIASAGTNAELGLLRAWAVVRILRRDPRLAKVQFAGYSAAQMLDLDGQVSAVGNLGDNPARRRIEIRVRRSSKAIRATPLTKD
jgi:hypothetical protein